MQNFARLALDIAKEQGMFLVIDADGLYTVGNHLNSIRGYRRAVLTPNVVEFKRLSGEVVRAEPHVLSTFLLKTCLLGASGHRSQYTARGTCVIVVKGIGRRDHPPEG